MDSYNVLIIAYYFPPMGLSGVQRIAKFVKYLPDFGWNPFVLTSNSAAYYAFDEEMVNELNSNNIKIFRTEEDITKHLKKSDKKQISYPSKFRQKFQSKLLQTFLQPDSRRFWMKNALKKADEIIAENKIDVILSTAPPFTDFMVAQKLSKKYDIPYICDYRDLWVDNPYYFYATFFHKNYAFKLEKNILKSSRTAIVITRDMKSKLLNRYRFLSNNDVAIIPHGYDQADFDSVKNSVKKSSKFVISHSGVFSADLTPRYFFQALAILFDEKPNIKQEFDIRFIGILQKSFQKLIKKLELDDVINTTDYLPHSESVRNLLESDVLWMMIPQSIVTPSRFYEYLGARKPIIMSSPESELTRIAESANASIIVGYKDIIELKNAIYQYYDLWKKNELPVPDEALVVKYERKFLAKQLSKELALSVKYRPV
ncbi:MAG: hypothetical protein A2X64_11280 [Ignavibacteria bacterium GWF2_33_9]|nr:MAG: hypothetical protein A2X64_11280 [Ignavibacteria bacterium GWF2_33_9]